MRRVHLYLEDNVQTEMSWERGACWAEWRNGKSATQAVSPCAMHHVSGMLLLLTSSAIKEEKNVLRLIWSYHSSTNYHCSDCRRDFKITFSAPGQRKPVPRLSCKALYWQHMAILPIWVAFGRNICSGLEGYLNCSFETSKVWLHNHSHIQVLKITILQFYFQEVWHIFSGKTTRLIVSLQFRSCVLPVKHITHGASVAKRLPHGRRVASVAGDLWCMSPISLSLPHFLSASSLWLSNKRQKMPK